MSQATTHGPSAANPRAIRQRRLIIRIGLILVWLGLIAFLFNSGKGHTLLVDNQAIDGMAPLPGGFSVSIDGRDPVEFSFGLDRDMVKLQGQNHHVTVTGLAEGRSVSKDFSIKLGDEMALLSIPRLVAGSGEAVSAFVPTTAPTTPGAGEQGGSYSSPASSDAPALPDGGLGLGIGPAAFDTGAPASPASPAKPAPGGSGQP
jgi:hypothetical protein